MDSDSTNPASCNSGRKYEDPIHGCEAFCGTISFAVRSRNPLPACGKTTDAEAIEDQNVQEFG